MRVALYNQMFGICGTKLLPNILGHWAVHFQKNPQKAYKKANLDETIKAIIKSNADIAGICEALEGQEEELKAKLAKAGYNHCFFGEGHKTKYSRLLVKTAIASKIPCRVVSDNGFPVKNEMGGGGGYVHCRLPRLKTEVFCAHLANPKKRELYEKQIRFLQKNISRQKNRIILMGDFNLPFEKIKDKFAGLELASNKIKTCSMTPFFRIFRFQDLDHILTKGFRCTKQEAISGYSDHMMVVAELDYSKVHK